MTLSQPTVGRPRQRQPLAGVLVACALIAALCACNLSQGGASGTERPTPGTEASLASVAGGGAPAVRILSPADGQQVPANQPVDITVATGSTATSFLLNVEGRVAASKALPPGQSGPTEAILSWTPDRQGTFTLEVIAMNGDQASDPAALTLTVSGSAAPGDGDAASGGCTGRVLVGQLNFRDGPGTRAAKLGQFEIRETVRVVGRNADTTWYQVERATGAQQVWTINNSQWIQTQGLCGTALPVVE